MSPFMTWASLLLASTAAAEACDRAFLATAAAQYITAQTTGQLAGFTVLGSNVTYTEDEKPTDITKSVLTHPIKLNYSNSFYDTTACATLTEAVATDPQAPYIIHTRMLFGSNEASPPNQPRRVHIMESIVTKPGDWAFNATGYASWSAFEHWVPIPAGFRDSRAAIQAAGDAYFDRFNNISVVIPIGSACTRLEGGSYTARGKFDANTCDAYPSNIKVTGRRYVVDEDMGVVGIFLGFPGLDRSVPKVAVPDSHIFRVEGGRLRYIHTVSKCINPDCGLNRSSTFGMENQKRSMPVRLPLPFRPWKA